MAGRENVRKAADTTERPRSPGPVHAAARCEGPQTAADRTEGSNLARFLCDINDLLAVQVVSGEPVSAEFPVKQGKYREILRFRGFWHTQEAK